MALRELSKVIIIQVIGDVMFKLFKRSKWAKYAGLAGCLFLMVVLLGAACGGGEATAVPAAATPRATAVPAPAPTATAVPAATPTTAPAATSALALSRSYL